MQDQILAALGGSYAYDDLRGDFAAARTLADAWLSAARAGADPGALADALLAAALVRILQGEPVRALDLIAEAERDTPAQPNRLLRAQTFRLFATYDRYNTLLDGAGAGAVEIAARWRGAADLAPEDARWQSLYQGGADPLVLQEAWLIYGFLCNLKPARYVLESSRFSPPGTSRGELLESLLSSPAQLAASARASGLPAVASYAELCCADLARRGGSAELAAESLDRAEADARLAGDPAGLALCILTRADALAAPFSTPLAWNFAVVDSSSEGSHLQVPLEAQEFSLPSEADRSKASELYREAGRIFGEAGAPRGAAAVSLRQGYLAMLADDFPGAEVSAHEAMERFEAAGDARGARLAAAHALMARIGAGAETGIAESASSIGAWGAQSGSFSFTLGIGIILNRWARHWLIRRGSYERSLAAYRAAAALFEALGAASNVVQNIVDRGTVHQAIGDRAAALTLYEEALDRLAAQIEERPALAENLSQRALMLAASVYQLYLQDMNADGMERAAARLDDLASGLPSAAEGADAFAARLAEGAAPAMEALEAGIGTWSLRSLAATFVEMSRVLAPLYRSRRAKEGGRPKDAAARLAEAEAALPAVGADQRSLLEVSVRLEQGRNAEAAEACRRHLAGGADAGFVGVLTRLMAGAGEQAEAALQRRRTHEQAFAIFVRVKDYAAAKEQLEALETLAGPEWWAQDSKPWQPLSDKGEMYEGLGDLAAASQAYARAIAELEARRGTLGRDELRTALAGDKGAKYLYFQAARTAIKRKDYSGAFDLAERARARGLLDLMAGSAALATLPEAGGALGAWRELSARVALRRGLLARERSLPQPDPERIGQITAQIEADEQRLGEARAGLARVAPGFEAAVNPEAPTLSLDHVAGALPSGALLLEYLYLGEEFLAWAVDRGGLVQSFSASVDAAGLDRTISAYHRACEGREPVDAFESELAERFLDPFGEVISRHTRLVFVPHGAAHALPFHALPLGGVPLIASHAVSYLPSASALQFLTLAGGPLPAEAVLAIGNPTGDLPAAEAEAGYVAGLFGSQPLLGRDATEAAVRAGLRQAPLLHFATHGRLSEDSPLASALILAGGDELTVYELAGLRLDAGLVVLSACSTGQGEATGGDDVVGLTRGLLAAGARAAVVSLWRVDDFSTSLLMGHFYRRVREGASPAEALRSAQRYLQGLDRAAATSELRALHGAFQGTGASRSARDARRPGEAEGPDDYSHPYYWAPFVLVG